MKLKKIALLLISVGALLAASNTFAGLMLVNRTNIASNSITASCTPGAKNFIPIFGHFIGWKQIDEQYLDNAKYASCLFYYDEQPIASGTITFDNNFKIGSVTGLSLNKEYVVKPERAVGKQVIMLFTYKFARGK